MNLRRGRLEASRSTLALRLPLENGVWASPRHAQCCAHHKLGDVGYDLRVLATWQVIFAWT